MYVGAFKTAKDADGYYIPVQYFAEKYGDGADDLAEKVFKECGMVYDPALLRTPDSVRRVGYNLNGINSYNIQVKPYTPEMTHEQVRLYNQQIRMLSRQMLLTEEQLRVLAGDGLLVAANEGGQIVGFVHCWVDRQAQVGSVEALIFSDGRFYEPVARKLVRAARFYFSERKIKNIQALEGHIRYPHFHALPGDILASFAGLLAHIHQKLVDICSPDG